MQALKLTDADWIAIEREHCGRSFRNFIKQAWHAIEPDTPYKHNWHIDAMADHLQAVSNGDIKNLIINVPPGCMKSLSVCVFWPAWDWIENPHLRWLFASYASHLSARDSDRTRILIQSEWYQRLWGDKYSLTKCTETNIRNDRLGFRLASSVGGVGTGERVHRTVNDDLVRANDALSGAMQKQAVAHMEAMSTRGVDPKTYSQVLIMQRIAQNDPTAWAIERGWDILMLPMEYEPSRKCVTSIGYSDPRTEDGELIWPDHFPSETIPNFKLSLGSYGYAAQMQQSPSPIGGGLIRGENFHRYNIPPIIKYRRIYGDTAQKTAERHDYSVFQCWGLGVDGKIYLIDQIRGKWEAPELKRRCVDFWVKHKALDDKTGALQRMGIEDKASGTGLIQDIKRDNQIPIFPIQRSKDKYTRVTDILGYIESGYVSIPDNSPFVSDFVAECEAFTADDSHAHDDQIDPMCDAIVEMLQSNSLKAWENMI